MTCKLRSLRKNTRLQTSWVSFGKPLTHWRVEVMGPLIISSKNGSLTRYLACFLQKGQAHKGYLLCKLTSRNKRPSNTSRCVQREPFTGILIYFYEKGQISEKLMLSIIGLPVNSFLISSTVGTVDFSCLTIVGIIIWTKLAKLSFSFNYLNSSLILNGWVRNTANAYLFFPFLMS